MNEYKIIVIGNMWRDLDVVELPVERPVSDYTTKRIIGSSQNLDLQEEKLTYPNPCHGLSKYELERESD